MTDNVQELSELARNNAMQLLMQVRQLSNLNRKANAIHVALNDYKKLNKQNADKETDKAQRFDKIQHNQVSLQTGENNLIDSNDKLNKLLLSIIKSLDTALTLPNEFKIDEPVLANGAVSSTKAYAEFINAVNTLQQALGDQITTNNYDNIKQDLNDLRGVLKEYFENRNQKYLNRQAKVEALKKLRDQLTEINNFLTRFSGQLANRIEHVDTITKQLEQSVNKLVPTALLESDNDIMLDFANSERFEEFNKPKTVVSDLKEPETKVSEVKEQSEKPVDKPAKTEHPKKTEKKKHWWMFG